MTGIMSLLTPSESHAFQSFLSQLDTTELADWNMHLEISHEHLPPAHGTDALTKATKDLMSLDADKWRHPLGAHHRDTPSYRAPPTQDSTEDNDHQPPPSHSSAFRTRVHLPPLQHVVDAVSIASRTRAKLQSCHRSSSSSQSPIDPSSSSTLNSTPAPSTKRSPPPDANVSNKRHCSTTESQRAALLSPSQKKANHIQSEQKRRANIRRGYDALCEIVPALREACHAEDERILACGKAKGRRRGKAKAVSDDAEKVDGRAGPRSENVVLSKTIDYVNDILAEREALLQRLHVARSVLPVGHPLLHRQPDAPPPLWEREWTGGESKEGDDDDDDEEDNED